MARQDSKLPEFLITLALVLTGAIVQPLVQGTYSAVGIGIVVAAILLCVILALKKPSLNPSSLRASAESVANDFRWWFGIIAVFWLYTISMNAVVEIRRNNEIVALRNDTQSIARVIERGVLPRHLTRSQQFTISGFLKESDPYEVAFKVRAGDSEASGYRADLQQALTKAGWKLASVNPITYADDMPDGLQISFTQTMEHSQIRDDPRNPKPPRLLQMALGLAGVRVDGSGSGSGIHVTQDSLLITIGRRRKDSYEITPPDGPF
jgi:hypothetical protein